jgi:hypothetical protein
MARAATDLLNGMADAFEQLRVAVERKQHALEDPADVVEPRLEKCLRFHSFDLQLDLTKVGVRADLQVEKLPDLGHEGDLDVQVIDLDVDLVDLDDRDVDQDVRPLGHVARIEDGVVGILLSLALAAARLAAAVGAVLARIPRCLGRAIPLDSPRG